MALGLENTVVWFFKKFFPLPSYQKPTSCVASGPRSGPARVGWGAVHAGTAAPPRQLASATEKNVVGLHSEVPKVLASQPGYLLGTDHTSPWPACCVGRICFGPSCGSLDPGTNYEWKMNLSFNSEPEEAAPEPPHHVPRTAPLRTARQRLQPLARLFPSFLPQLPAHPSERQCCLLSFCKLLVGHLSPPVPDWASQYLQRGVTWLPPAHTFSSRGQGGPSKEGEKLCAPSSLEPFGFTSCVCLLRLAMSRDLVPESSRRNSAGGDILARGRAAIAGA
ncbi:hypothetical protein Celaphus_00006075, partial [Cervus elaphus hippelaphus]